MFDVDIWETYVHIHTKYEVSLFEPVAIGEVCTDGASSNDVNDNDANNGQSVIV